MPWIKQTFHLTRERRTYIMGEFTGKYHGEIDEDKKGLTAEEYYNLTLYEGVIVLDSVDKLRKEEEGPFPGFGEEDKFPGKLPDPLPCEISFPSSKDTYKLDIHDIRFQKNSIQLIDHQQEDSEVFGTLKAIVTGYIRDEVGYDQERDVWVEESSEHKVDPITEQSPQVQTTPSGQGSNRDGKWSPYIQQQRYANHNGGCLEALFQMIGIVLFILFLFAIGPGAFVILGIGLLWFLLSLLNERIVAWVLRLFGVAMLLLFVYAMVSGIKSDLQKRKTKQKSTYVISKDDKEEKSERRTTRRRTAMYDDPSTTTDDLAPIVDTAQMTDTVISHYRIWRDYRGRRFEGDLKVLLSACERSFMNRTRYTPLANQFLNQYDQLLYTLTMNDRRSLGFVYQMFDSIGRANQLSREDFAEMIVSCVQDIPYTLVLNDGCNPNLYNDDFIRRYLSEGNQCDGNVKFGLYSPVEFMANLKGDCDTRTLLLFTILSHFNYEVVILSSEYYKHSILAINLPYTGTFKDVNGKHYYTWETTFMNFIPGQLPTEVSNINFWRISLINQKNKQ